MADILVKALRDTLQLGAQQSSKLRPLDDQMRGIFEAPFYPSDGHTTVEREYRQLVTRAELPMLSMIVRAVVDRLLVDGITVGGDPEEQYWDWWQSSRLDARQSQIYADALTYGDGYLVVTPGENGPVFTPESPMVLAVQNSPYDPMATQVAAKQIGEDRAWLYTDEAIYAFERERSPQQWRVVAETPHAAGVCPVVRFPNRLDSAGRSMSEVLEVLPIQRRINQTIMTRLLLEASAAWRQRWVAGIDVDNDADGNAIPPFRMGVDKLLVAPDSDTTFGEFSESSTQDLMAAVEQDLRHIAVCTQTPPTLFAVTSISNISSESLAALEGGLTRKVGVKQSNFGESLEYAMRIGGAMVGVTVPDGLEMSWKDLEISSVSQRSNAYVQLRGSGLPVEYLAETVLNLTPQSIERLKAQLAQEIADGTSPMLRTENAPVAGQIPQSGEPFTRGNQGRVN